MVCTDADQTSLRCPAPFGRSNTGIFVSNPTWCMDTHLFLIFVTSCEGRGLAKGRSPVQGLLTCLERYLWIRTGQRALWVKPQEKDWQWHNPQIPRFDLGSNQGCQGGKPALGLVITTAASILSDIRHSVWSFGTLKYTTKTKSGFNTRWEHRWNSTYSTDRQVLRRGGPNAPQQTHRLPRIDTELRYRAFE
jgi:hypothetical protein